MLLQGFSADADSIPWSQVVASGNNENHNNLVSSRYTKFSYVWLLSFLLFILFFFFLYLLFIYRKKSTDSDPAFKKKAYRSTRISSDLFTRFEKNLCNQIQTHIQNPVKYLR